MSITEKPRQKVPRPIRGVSTGPRIEEHALESLNGSTRAAWWRVDGLVSR